MTFSSALGAAVLLDMMLGDSLRFPAHPVVRVGQMIKIFERLLYSRDSVLRGVLMCCAVVAAAAGAAAAVMFAFADMPTLSSCACVWMLYRALAWRSLKDETIGVASALLRHDIRAARTALSRVVGRDTDTLGEPAAAAAAVETIAENASDGVFSVMFWAAIGWRLGGAAGTAVSVWAFKAVSTMDSMIGYDDERYRYFGRAAARLDDAMNFIPARIGGLVTVAAGTAAGFAGMNGLRIFLRDRKKHKSPNSAHGESAFAGLLGIQLGGGAFYGGKFESRPHIGDALREPSADDILSAHRLLDASCALFAMLTAALC